MLAWQLVVGASRGACDRWAERQRAKERDEQERISELERKKIESERESERERPPHTQTQDKYRLKCSNGIHPHQQPTSYYALAHFYF